MSDRPSSEIQPALTAEEWRTLKLWHAGKMIGGKVRGMVVGDLPESHQHGAAAFALYGKPYGFTHEDVEDERQAYVNATMLARRAQDAGDEAERQRFIAMAARHYHRAARIAALLPPTP